MPPPPGSLTQSFIYTDLRLQTKIHSMITAFVDRKRAQLKGLLLVRLQIQNAELHQQGQGSTVHVHPFQLTLRLQTGLLSLQAPGQKVLASWKV